MNMYADVTEIEIVTKLQYVKKAHYFFIVHIAS